MELVFCLQNKVTSGLFW